MNFTEDHIRAMLRVSGYISNEIWEKISDNTLSDDFIREHYTNLNLNRIKKVFFFNDKVVFYYRTYNIKRDREKLLKNPYKYLKHSRSGLKIIANEVIKGNFIIIDNAEELEKKLQARKEMFIYRLTKVLRNDPFKTKPYNKVNIGKAIEEKLIKNPDMFYELLTKETE